MNIIKLVCVFTVVLIMFEYVRYKTDMVVRILPRPISPISLFYGIPKIIFRRHYTKTVPYEMYQKCYKKWADLNPDFHMVWYTNKECEKQIKTFGTRIYNAYISLVSETFRADIWRACMLYRYGGVYVDSYTTPYMSIRKMLEGCVNSENNTQLITVLDRYNFIHNGFIIATPNHPIMGVYLRTMIERIEKKFYGTDPLEITGPKCFAHSIEQFFDDKNYIHKTGWNKYHTNHPYYLFKYSWSLFQFIYKNDVIILRKKYSLVSYLLSKTGSNVYWKLWRDRQIYK